MSGLSFRHHLRKVATCFPSFLLRGSLNSLTARLLLICRLINLRRSLLR